MSGDPKFPKLFREAFAKFPNIVSDRSIMSGAPCIRGSRIATWIIAGRFAAGETVNYIAKDYGISREAVLEAIRFTCWTSRIGAIKFWKFWEGA